MPPELEFTITIALGCLGFCFFALAWSLLMRSRTSRLKEFAEQNVSGAARALKLIEQGEKYILSAQAGAFIVTLALGAQIYQFLALNQPTFLAWTGEQTCGLMCALLAFGCFLGLSFFVFAAAQILKSVTFGQREKVLCFLAAPIQVVAWALFPLVGLIILVIQAFERLSGVKIQSDRERAVSAEEISEMVELGSESGQIEDDELEMIQGIFSFSNTIVREVMTPRKDIISVREDAPLQEIVRVLADERVSRILVTGEELDEVRGVIIAKDLMRFLGPKAEPFDLRKVMRPPFLVPNTKKIDELLQELRHKAVHLAIVMDEHGGVDGLVTIEDLIEEIVGEIFDEHDSPTDETGIRSTKSGDLLVQGSTLIDDLNSQLRVDFPAGHYDTLAGFVINLLGRIPQAGDTVEHQGMRIRVEVLEQNRITLLRLIGGRKLLNSQHSVSPDSSEPKRVLAESKPSGGSVQSKAGNA